MYQKDLNISFLLDFYGEAIPEKQREILSQYYDEDLSLSEIAENFGMSRQGARHLIKKGEAELLFLEEKLGLAHIHRDATHNYTAFLDKAKELELLIKDSGENEELLLLLSELKEAAEAIIADL